jgi:hypothetical protein
MEPWVAELPIPFTLLVPPAERSIIFSFSKGE